MHKCSGGVTKNVTANFPVIKYLQELPERHSSSSEVLAKIAWQPINVGLRLLSCLLRSRAPKFRSLNQWLFMKLMSSEVSNMTNLSKNLYVTKISAVNTPLIGLR